MKKEQFKGSAQLLLATLIWGCAFVAQSVGMDHMEPMSFQAVRSLLAVAALLPTIYCMDKEKSGFFARWKDKALWKTGIPCGIALFAAQGLQQTGLLYTEPGKAGFITAMYIVLVPVLGLFLGRKCGLRIWVSVALAVGGLYLLSCVGVSKVNLGDILILGSALCFAVQIVLIDVLAQELDGIRISSTHIRKLIESGKMESATRFLGHPYFLTGTVVHGHQLGRKLGIPTANLLLPEGLAIPRFGVYACRALIDGKKYLAVTNIGTRPTVSGQGITVEPWILDFEGDLYGRKITLEFHYFLRAEMKFPDLTAMQSEIRRNAEQTRVYFQEQEAPHGES